MAGTVLSTGYIALNKIDKKIPTFIEVIIYWGPRKRKFPLIYTHPPKIVRSVMKSF